MLLADMSPSGGGGIIMPPDSVTGPILHLLGVLLWFVAAALIYGGYLAGVEIAASRRHGAGTGPGEIRLLCIVIGAIATSSAAAYGGWLLI